MKPTVKDKIRVICTYQGDDVTSGYLLTEDQFEKIFALIDQAEENATIEVQKSLMEDWKDDIKQAKRQALNEAISIFEDLPEDEVMTRNPILLELKVLRDKDE